MATQRRAALKQKMKQKSVPKRPPIAPSAPRELALVASAFWALRGLHKPTQEGGETRPRDLAAEKAEVERQIAAQPAGTREYLAGKFRMGDEE